MDKTSLGDRMKQYERNHKYYLIKKVPVIVRIDGRAFHSLKLDKPYDLNFYEVMKVVAKGLLEQVQNCKLAYSQSDEISLLLFDNAGPRTECFFDNNIQKIVSITASIAAARFNKTCYYNDWWPLPKTKDIVFDSRVFNMPIHEVENYFIWRQQDATRNSIQMLGRAHFSHKELHKKNVNDIQDMLMLQKDINWNDTQTYFKRGWCITKNGLDEEIPIFTQDRNYIRKHLSAEEL